MRQGTRINSWQDLQTVTNSCLNLSTGFHNQSTRQKQQPLKATMYYETNHSSAASRPLSPPPTFINSSHERAKSVDYSRLLFNETTPMAPSASSMNINTLKNDTTKTTSRISRSSSVRNNTNGFHSSTIFINEVHTTQKECEKRELNLLNNRFGNYLDRIKNLANTNANLHRQVDDTYRKYMGHSEEQQTDTEKKTYKNPLEVQLKNLRKQINNEVRAQTLVQIRLQRAEYDLNFYQNNIKLLSTHEHKQSEQIKNMKKQIEINVNELEQLKQQYDNREQDLRMYKNQYDDCIKKLTEFSNTYDQIVYDRMENENNLCTLKEQLSFEQEYFHRRQQEFQCLEKIQYDLNKDFHQTEFHVIVKKIRNDYQELNDVRLAELEKVYKTKLDAMRNEQITHQEQAKEPSKASEMLSAIESTRQEHRLLIEQNQKLQDKLEQAEHDLHHIIDHNRQYYEKSDREYKKLQVELPELDCIIVHLRENAVNLWSEINTYRYLLVNLLSSDNEKSSKRPSSTPPNTSSISVNTQKQPEKVLQPSPNSIKTVKPITNQIKSTPFGTKTRSSPQQYRDETTGFTVHIEDGIVWVRI